MLKDKFDLFETFFKISTNDTPISFEKAVNLAERIYETTYHDKPDGITELVKEYFP